MGYTLYQWIYVAELSRILTLPKSLDLLDQCHQLHQGWHSFRDFGLSYTTDYDISGVIVRRGKHGDGKSTKSRHENR